MKSDILGIIGGGQLGMFMCIAAKKIGAKTIVFSTEKNFSAKSFCDRYILGSFDDKTKLDEFINSADVFTIETENINELTIVLNRLVEKLDEDRNVKDHLTTISSILKNLGEVNTGKMSEIQSNLTLELRAIAKQLLNIEKSVTKLNNKE